MVYLLLGLYIFNLNAVGPTVRYLHNEFNFSYTFTSFHVSAFALGKFVTALFGNTYIRRMNQWKGMGIAALGMGLGGIMLILARHPLLSLGALFIMGLIGTIIVNLYPVMLVEEMGERSAIGINEANTLAAIFAASAPLLIGLFASTQLGWRFGLLIGAVFGAGLGIWLLMRAQPTKPTMMLATDAKIQSGRLSKQFWLIWGALACGLAVEFCIVSWVAEYLDKGLGFELHSATRWMVLFPVGIIAGRFIGSWLIKRMHIRKILTASLAIVLVGFGLFWSGITPTLGLVGVFTLGLGVSNFYGSFLTLSLQAAGTQKADAAARDSLASAISLLFLPLTLGALADTTGMRSAYLVVPVLLVAIIGFLSQALREPIPD